MALLPAISDSFDRRKGGLIVSEFTEKLKSCVCFSFKLFSFSTQLNISADSRSSAFMMACEPASLIL
ncbi:hypothetical protein [Acetivibrio cellulolyticus]